MPGIRRLTLVPARCRLIGMFPQFDPSKMDPKVLMELSQLIQQLPPEKLQRMQTLMHNMMAGFDVRAEMEEFERGLPPGFRERLAGMMAGQTAAFSPAPPSAAVTSFEEPAAPSPANMDLREARLTLLRGVATGKILPEEAEKLLFPAEREP